MTTSPNPKSADTTQTDEDLMREQRLQRNLKILVGALGALIIVGIGAVGWRATNVMNTSSSNSSPASGGTMTAVAKPGGEISLELPKGAKVTNVTMSGNRLAVTHDSPSGTMITIIDFNTGRRIADVKTIEAVPRN